MEADYLCIGAGAMGMAFVDIIGLLQDFYFKNNINIFKIKIWNLSYSLCTKQTR